MTVFWISPVHEDRAARETGESSRCPEGGLTRKHVTVVLAGAIKVLVVSLCYLLPMPLYRATPAMAATNYCQ